MDLKPSVGSDDLYMMRGQWWDNGVIRGGRFTLAGLK
jgi:hypothetical protein